MMSSKRNSRRSLLSPIVEETPRSSRELPGTSGDADDESTHLYDDLGAVVILLPVDEEKRAERGGCAYIAQKTAEERNHWLTSSPWPMKTQPGTGWAVCLDPHQQGAMVAHFLLRMMMMMRKGLALSQDHSWSQVRSLLNRGTGVVDVAGGAGYVSLALAGAGIQSTVLDPVAPEPPPARLHDYSRRSAGEACLDHPSSWLPYRVVRGRLETVIPTTSSHSPPFSTIHDSGPSWRMTLDSSSSSSAATPVVANLLTDCTALVGFHPDAATDALVDVAVQRRIPLVVVPCCVLAHQFSHRRYPINTTTESASPGTPDRSYPVECYADLIQYLRAKDDSIQQIKLPFPGSNILLWSTFDEPS